MFLVRCPIRHRAGNRKTPPIVIARRSRGDPGGPYGKPICSLGIATASRRQNCATCAIHGRYHGVGRSNMSKISSAEFHKHLGRNEDLALNPAVAINRNDQTAVRSHTLRQILEPPEHGLRIVAWREGATERSRLQIHDDHGIRHPSHPRIVVQMTGRRAETQQAEPKPSDRCCPVALPRNLATTAVGRYGVAGPEHARPETCSSVGVR